MTRHLTLALLTLICLPCIAAAADDDPAAAEPKPPPIVRRIYDVADLVHPPTVDAETTSVLPPTEVTRNDSRLRPAGASGNAPAGRSSNESAPDGLIRLIQNTIDPVSWRDAGGTDGSIIAFGAQLVVTATEQNHRALKQLLDDLRDQAHRPVRLRATWALLSDDELRTVTTARRAVDLPALERLQGVIRNRAEINCLSGLRVNITAGRARSAMTAVDAVVGNASAALQPTIDLVLAGITLQVTPVLSADAQFALLDVRATAGQWDRPDAPPMKLSQPVATSQPTAPPPPAAPLEIERLNLPVHLVATSVRIPTGQPTLIGGITVDSNSTERRQMYLILEASTSRTSDPDHPTTTPTVPTRPAAAPPH